MNGLEPTYAGRITFLRINILNAKNTEIMEHYGFTTAPELLLVDGQDKVLASWDELVTAADLRQAFDRILSGQAAE